MWSRTRWSIHISDKISTTAVNNTGVKDIWVILQSSMYPSFNIGTIYRHLHATAESFDYLEEVLSKISVKRNSISSLVALLTPKINQMLAGLAGLANHRKHLIRTRCHYIKQIRSRCLHWCYPFPDHRPWTVNYDRYKKTQATTCHKTHPMTWQITMMLTDTETLSNVLKML